MAKDAAAAKAAIILKWKHRIGHECGHITAALAHEHVPDGLQLGQLVDEKDGSIHHGLTVGGALPDGATAEAKAMALLAGMVAEGMLFGSHGNGAKRDLDMTKPFVDEIRAREGETRTAEKILDDLTTDAKKLLAENKGLLDLLYSEAVERVEGNPGFEALEKPGVAVQVFTGEMIKFIWEHHKGEKPE